MGAALIMPWPRICASTCCAPLAIRRASELTVTNWKPLAMRASAASGVSYNDATSYLTIFGGWKNTLHVLARINRKARIVICGAISPYRLDGRSGNRWCSMW